MSIVVIALIVFAAFLVFSAVRVVPQQETYVIERLGKFYASLPAGLHIIIPFMDRIAYRHSLKEMVIDIPEQACITKDNVLVHVDGILFYRVMDPQKASYGVSNYDMGLIQLAQTTLRSEIGKIDLDRTFEERERVNAGIVMSIDKASDPWGVKVLRYEIKSITPPADVLAAMEKQMRAEREKRAVVLESEGARDAKINSAEGFKQEVIKQSEAQRQRQINEAEGQASAILAVAEATARGLERIGQALAASGGRDAAQLKIAEEYVAQFGKIAKTNNTVIVPANLSDLSGMIAGAFSVMNSFEKSKPVKTS